ncbi:ADP-ribosylglycohydrolase [Aquabacterium sp. NJ1]|uniref:ADP-ribosylglycohydrolase family protein n=1 Tax=Aquabacterium sp. NJ1 TaxID=1538295 RepID=UPI00052D5C3C|nr:ADP-ribosylglycohydrolase family protein [Aquabacterium sp. NJ1]KGM40429.1 ADP-ribosylglycohydrolase [Aquabacterium sp. NJ1]
MDLESRYRGCLLGLACGDAVGTTVEFCPRGSFDPITDMVGGGPFNLKPGQWTDDTAMAICLAQSLLHRSGFDATDQMNRYLNWWRWGYPSPTGECFDIGMTVQDALLRFTATGEPIAGSTSPNTAGNGSLMRLAPVVLRFYPDLSDVLQYARLSSQTTHGAAEAVECCSVLAEVIANALSGMDSKSNVLSVAQGGLTSSAVISIAQADYLSKSRDQIQGSGYCVASLEAALWSFATTESFEAAILAAANLGDDADTTAAIAGQIAGAFYGVDNIPLHWRGQLYMSEDIDAMARGLLHRDGRPVPF